MALGEFVLELRQAEVRLDVLRFDGVLLFVGLGP